MSIAAAIFSENLGIPVNCSYSAYRNIGYTYAVSTVEVKGQWCDWHQPFKPTVILFYSQGLADSSVIAKINGELWDLDRPLEKDSELQLLKFDDEEGKYEYNLDT